MEDSELKDSESKVKLTKLTFDSSNKRKPSNITKVVEQWDEALRVKYGNYGMMVALKRHTKDEMNFG